MKYRKLGKTDLMVSEIGLGCSGYWGDKHFSEAKAIQVVLAAVERGVNFFDTGSNYSNFHAEPRLGRALTEVFKQTPREKIIVSTKAGSLSGYAPQVADDDLSNTDFSPEAIRRSCLKSIENLNCGHIDLFQLHGFKPEMLNDELFACLRELKQEGLIRYTGINTHFEKDLVLIQQHADIFDMVLIDCNLLQLDRFEIIQTLTDSGIGVVIGTVLAQGHLIRRKIGSLRDGSFFWYLARTLLKPTTRDFFRMAPRMRKLLRRLPEMSPAQAAFCYPLSNPNISSCLFGSTNVEHVREITEVPNLTLRPESRAAIEAEYERIRSLSR
jgi:aryl-alcohol dehydrogenase-like predicted oxidoreductase